MKRVINLVPIDDLDRAIVTLSARINAETYELLVLIREFDERAGWLKWGLGNCAEWLHYRCDFSMNAARGMMKITIELPLETGGLVEKALDKARDDSTPMAC